MKKYILKPGRHQFAAGSLAVHTNDNLTDEEAEWYLKRYPHIAGLFEIMAEDIKSISPPAFTEPSPKPKRKRIGKTPLSIELLANQPNLTT